MIRTLSPRERDVLRLVAEGLENAEIGARLGCTKDTVRAHMQHILDKTGAVNRTHAAAMAVREGIA